eukprot:UN23249
MDVTLDDNGDVTSCTGNPVWLGGDMVEQEPNLLSWIATEWETISDSYANVVGQNRVFASGQKSVVRMQESAMGNLMTDAMVQINTKYADDVNLGLRIAFHNGGGLRSDLPPGDVTLGNILEILPWANDMVTIKDVP